MVAALVILAILGLAFGSFTNALTWRIHEQGKKKGKSSKDLSILHGRSMCPRCKHQLAAKDLVPVISWLYLRGRCRYCKKPISIQYPLVELALAAIFVLSYVWWPHGVHSAGQWVLLITWLASAVGLMSLAIYDIRWWFLPNKIIYPTLLVAVAGRVVYLAGFEHHKGHALLEWALALLVSSGIFWVLFMVSNGKWIGFGDVRLGMVTGTLLATPSKSFLMILLASVIGTLFILPAIALGKKSVTSKLPYGPFLIGATWFVLLFGGGILDWYKRVFLP